ncbi:prolyl 4-hydroxylase [Novosphingobium sp. SG751A]|uniref:2OG-Fe(II) oxygenase n=1 Tax=Novosphingobium sp. SG751A TaxID=2587000 RepID=UPI001552D6F2|nr:2OG-Fe(II) oxygenase [Novosphingobium sp. SG751A]NOW47350.1 prolyl 4-hydroxylase [Novosphingobium sp. SG751A]
MALQSVLPSTLSQSAAIDSHGAEWRDWVFTNVRAGCDHADMAERMVAAGWTAQMAAQAIAFAAETDEHPGALCARPELPVIGVSDIKGQSVAVTMRLAAPAIAVCENVFSAQECEQLIGYARTRGLRASTVVDETDGRAVAHPERSSTGVMLTRAETDLVARIEGRLAALTSWPVENCEGLQILHYAPGQEYRPHFDAFPLGKAGDVHRAKGGQRVNTILVYLRSPERGGGTVFPNLGLTLRPQQGAAIMFHNVDAAGKRANEALHGGEAVQAGEKIVLTYWQREGPFV